MPRYEIDKPRLFIDTALVPGASIPLAHDQSNYLRNVLRLSDQGQVLVFNGKDGEWLANLKTEGRKSAHLSLSRQIRTQTLPGDLHYCFAPLKHARLDYMVQKATEMGASRIVPVMTRRTQVSRVNLDRMRANIIEAAEQCGVLNVPEVGDLVTLDRLLENWPAERALVFCDEAAAVENPVEKLVADLKQMPGIKVNIQPMALLIGPEGGFEEAERKLVKSLPQTITIALGPRILRADTAAVAALAIFQAAAGDWRS